MVSRHTPSRLNPGSCTNGATPPTCRACGAELDLLLREDPALAKAWTALHQRRFEPGQLIAQAGDRTLAVWRVEQGLVRTYYLSADGMERNRSFHIEGQWLGVTSTQATPAAPRTAPYAIEALETTVLTELPHDTMRVWTQREDLRDRLTDALSQALARREEREESLLLKDASERYIDFMRQHSPLAARVPLHHVASYLGITNVALSRIRRRLREPSG